MLLALLALVIMTIVFYMYQRRITKKRRAEIESEMGFPYDTIETDVLTGNIRFCPYCGAQVNPGDVYCLSCGMKLPEDDDDTPVTDKFDFEP